MLEINRAGLIYRSAAIGCGWTVLIPGPDVAAHEMKVSGFIKRAAAQPVRDFR